MKKSKTNSSSRRDFVKKSIKAAALIPLTGISATAFGKVLSEPHLSLNKTNPKPLHILILGGTSFIGPHQIAYAIKRGHSITTFTRGKTQPTVYKDQFKKVEQLIGDRENNLEALKGRKWDVVIDNSGRKVDWTTDTATLLKDNVGMYVYVSSVSVFYPYYNANLTENDPLILKIPETFEDDNEKYTYEYGVMKANSEFVTRSIFGDKRSIIIRPTFMLGPADRTNRFLYWPRQLSKGSDVIVPGNKEDPVQFIDVRDVAEWMIRLIENKTSGTFNAVGPVSKMSISTFASKANAAFKSKSNLIAINDTKFLKEHRLQYLLPWIMDSKKYHGIARVSNVHSVKNGLTYRSLSTSIVDTHAWWNSDAVDKKRHADFEADKNELHNRQSEIIQKWKSYIKLKDK